MKRKYFTLEVFAMAYLGSAMFAAAQCNVDECVAKLSNGFTFLKSYKATPTVSLNEFSYVFSKDTDYMLLVCDKGGDSKNVIATVYNNAKKEIATNYDKKNDKIFPAFIYNCKVTGIYYIKFTFRDPIECCSGILAFKK